MTSEKVHTVTDYWDGPRKGIADYSGEPHYYESIFDETADDWSDEFWLTPLSSEDFKLAMEAWAIWLRWEAAFRAGKTDQSTHPALPEDRDQYRELRACLDKVLVVDATRSFKVRGEFTGSIQSGNLQAVWHHQPATYARGQ